MRTSLAIGAIGFAALAVGVVGGLTAEMGTPTESAEAPQAEQAIAAEAEAVAGSTQAAADDTEPGPKLPAPQAAQGAERP